MEELLVWICFLYAREIVGGDFDDDKSQKRAKRRDEIEAAEKKEFVILLDFVIKRGLE